jgi:diguanylate cyclase (GGDEF)-like protein
MKIKQLLAKKELIEVECVGPDATLRETAEKLIYHRIGALVVTDETGRLRGIVSERDLIHVVASFNETASERTVSEVMTSSVITCDPEDEIAYVMHLMNSNAIRHMPVLSNGKLVNMVSIRELTTAYEMLQKEADTDPLTELSNRRPFLKNLEKEFSRAKRYKHPLAVAMIDLDHFKLVNDTYGHDAGDRVLRAVSAMLISEFRTIDLVGRLGGEEFAVLLPETDLTRAKIACCRLLAAIEAAIIPVDGNAINVTASIGLAKASSKTLDGAGLLKRADALLYQAKTDGRNKVVAEMD